MSVSEALALPLLLAGAFFFFAGTVGVLRFPDTLTRLHALTKADNLGLGFVVAGLALQSTLVVALKVIAVWLLTIFASATSCYLIAGRALAKAEPESND